MSQTVIDMFAREVAQSAKGAIDTHIATDAITHAAMQDGQRRLEDSVEKMADRVEAAFGKLTKRLDWIIFMFLAGVGGAALSIVVAMQPWPK